MKRGVIKIALGVTGTALTSRYLEPEVCTQPGQVWADVRKAG